MITSLCSIVYAPTPDLGRFQVNRKRGPKRGRIIDRYRPPLDEGEHMAQVFGHGQQEAR